MDIVTGLCIMLVAAVILACAAYYAAWVSWERGNRYMNLYHNELKDSILYIDIGLDLCHKMKRLLVELENVRAERDNAQARLVQREE